MSIPTRTEHEGGHRLREACAELEFRLRAGRPAGAADILAEFPDLAADREAALELIYTDFVLREELGRPLPPEAWHAQFPQWEPDLRDLFRFHSQLLDRAGEPVPTVALGRGERPPLDGSDSPPARGPVETAAGGYELLGELGRGGMGVVYKARQKALNRVVALKMVLGGGHADPRALVRFRREAEAVARLRHPNIVQVYEVGEHDGSPFFTMEYLDGGTLAGRLAGRPLLPREAAALIEPLARAVDCAHRRGIVHRDLKPANVLLRRPAEDDPAAPTRAGEGPVSAPDHTRPSGPAGPVPTITDFGLAKLLSGDGAGTQTGAVMGTPAYMAPEQAAGDAKRVGPAADVYALGAILYECLAGRPPFQGATEWEVLYQVIRDAPVPPARVRPAVPRDLETVCLKCLAKDPDQRYASAALLADDLRRFLNDEPVLARHPSVAYQLAKFVRRNRVLVAGAAVVFLALVGGLVGTSVGLARATAERERAERAEGEVRARLAESYAQAAELAFQRGAWPDALDNLDKALAAGHPDRARLRLEKVRALYAMHDFSAADRDVQELQGRDAAGGLAAQILLWRADLALARSDDAAGLHLARDAVAGDLGPADREYAEGLLAGTAPEAARRFRAALDRDPFHHRALSRLGLLLVLQGKGEEAREFVAGARRTYPDDPTFVVLRAMLHARDGDLAAARADAERARGRLGERRFAAVVAVLNLVRAASRLDRLLPGNSPFTQAIAFVDFQSAARGVSRLPRPDLGPGAEFLVPTPPALSRSLHRLEALLAKAGLASMASPSREQVEELRQITLVYPDGLLFYLLGIMEFNAGHLPEAEAAFRRAVAGDSLVPVRRAALYAVTFCHWELHDREVATAAARMGELVKEVGECLRRLPRVGRPRLHAAGPAIQAWARAVELKRQALEGVQGLVQSGRLTPSEAELAASVALAMGEVDLARSLVREWERVAPGDLNAAKKRMIVEFNAGSYAAAIRAAEVVLGKQPGDRRALEYRQEATKRLRAQADRERPINPP